jgi:hypothetical protein
LARFAKGKAGEGDSFYILYFQTDGTVIVTKQFSGDNATEQKIWSMKDNELCISSAANAVITEFDGAILVRIAAVNRCLNIV